MKKKIAVGVMLLCVCASLFGCVKSTLNLVYDNLSEWTKVYYWGENEEFYCSLSSGEREEEYFLNGTSGKRVEFGLLSLILSENSIAKSIKVEVSIDGVKSEKNLELNTLNSSYMIDMEKCFTGNENIEVKYGGKTLGLTALSNDFVVKDSKAIEIATNELEDKIVLNKSFNNLNAECYLRVLDKKANQFEGVFWCFTVLNKDGGNFSVIISTVDGSILAKSK